MRPFITAARVNKTAGNVRDIDIEDDFVAFSLSMCRVCGGTDQRCLVLVYISFEWLCHILRQGPDESDCFERFLSFKYQYAPIFLLFSGFSNGLELQHGFRWCRDYRRPSRWLGSRTCPWPSPGSQLERRLQTEYTRSPDTRIASSRDGAESFERHVRQLRMLLPIPRLTLRRQCAYQSKNCQSNTQGASFHSISSRI